MANLRIIPYKQISKDLVFYIRDEVQKKLPTGLFEEVTASPDRLDVPDDSIAPSRRQYRAHDLLTQLIPHMPEEGRALCIIDEDIFIPKEDFVFGIAEEGRNALVALPRLREQFHGRAPEPSKFKMRALKVALHELGHALGLEICDNECVMKGIADLDEIDSIDPDYCEECSKAMRDRFLSQIGDQR